MYKYTVCVHVANLQKLVSTSEAKSSKPYNVNTENSYVHVQYNIHV